VVAALTSLKEVPLPLTNIRRGIALLLAAATLWSANGLFIKTLSAAGVDGWAIAAGRSLAAAVFLTPWALRHRTATVHPGWLALTILMFTLMSLTFVTATTLTSAANAIILQYTAPAWVFLLSPWLVGERSSPRQWLALVAAMIGVAVIFIDQYRGQPTGLAVALTSGFVFGFQSVLFRKVRAMHPLALAWLMCLGSGVLLAPGLLHVRPDIWTTRHVGLLILMGVVQFGGPYVLYAAGMQHVTAQQAILIIMLEPVLNPIWLWLRGIETPARSTLLGGVFILSAVAYLSLAALRSATARDRALTPADPGAPARF
jgi:drug/metabolite transporter (DMT)-like permease